MFHAFVPQHSVGGEVAVRCGFPPNPFPQAFAAYAHLYKERDSCRTLLFMCVSDRTREKAEHAFRDQFLVLALQAHAESFGPSHARDLFALERDLSAEEWTPCPDVRVVVQCDDNHGSDRDVPTA
jgi:hypothetical protein